MPDTLPTGTTPGPGRRAVLGGAAASAVAAALAPCSASAGDGAARHRLSAVPARPGHTTTSALSLARRTSRSVSPTRSPVATSTRTICISTQSSAVTPRRCFWCTSDQRFAVIGVDTGSRPGCGPPGAGRPPGRRRGPVSGSGSLTDPDRRHAARRQVVATRLQPGHRRE